MSKTRKSPRTPEEIKEHKETKRIKKRWEEIFLKEIIKAEIEELPNDRRRDDNKK